MYLNWLFWTVAGVMVGRAVVDISGLGLEFAMAATFVAIVVPLLRSRPMLASALVAGAVSLLARGLPYKLGLMGRRLPESWQACAWKRDGPMTQREIAAIVGMTAVTFASATCCSAWAGAPVARAGKRALHYVPVAVLTAIIVPMLLLPDGHWQPSWHNARSRRPTGVIAWRWLHLLGSIAAVTAVLVLWRGGEFTSK